MTIDKVFGRVISEYTIEQATEDGILFNIHGINPEWSRGPISHVTTNLLSKGYYTDEQKINIPNMLDLLNQALQFITVGSGAFKRVHSEFSGTIELPSGQSIVIMAALNELNKYTLMLPECAA